jgi:protein gp37
MVPDNVWLGVSVENIKEGLVGFLRFKGWVSRSGIKLNSKPL